MTVKSETLPFTIRRLQFPLQACFAMTVHKSQGQTLDCVGIYFPRPVWAHGLLYVAMSRVRRACNCFVVGVVDAVIANFCCAHVLRR